MQFYFITILSIAFVNVLMAKSWPIEPTAGEAGNSSSNENSDENLAEDGDFYNPDPVGGPVSAKMYEIHPQLAYLGEFNEKFWYIERTALTYAQALGNCTTMGMSIARTNQAELNFLFTVTLSTDLPWVGAIVPMQLSSFIWHGTNQYPTTRFTPAAANLALRINRSAENLSSLIQVSATTSRFALCTIP